MQRHKVEKGNRHYSLLEKDRDNIIWGIYDKVRQLKWRTNLLVR